MEDDNLSHKSCVPQIIWSNSCIPRYTPFAKGKLSILNTLFLHPGPILGMSWCSLNRDKYRFNSSTLSLCVLTPSRLNLSSSLLCLLSSYLLSASVFSPPTCLRAYATSFSKPGDNACASSCCDSEFGRSECSVWVSVWSLVVCCWLESGVESRCCVPSVLASFVGFGVDFFFFLDLVTPAPVLDLSFRAPPAALVYSELGMVVLIWDAEVTCSARMRSASGLWPANRSGTSEFLLGAILVCGCHLAEDLQETYWNVSGFHLRTNWVLSFNYWCWISHQVDPCPSKRWHLTIFSSLFYFLPIDQPRANQSRQSLKFFQIITSDLVATSTVEVLIKAGFHVTVAWLQRSRWKSFSLALQLPPPFSSKPQTSALEIQVAARELTISLIPYTCHTFVRRCCSIYFESSIAIEGSQNKWFWLSTMIQMSNLPWRNWWLRFVAWQHSCH